MAVILDQSANCGHCKLAFHWREVLVQRDTPGATRDRRRPRAFCPHCGYLVLDTPQREESWSWFGELNTFGNLETEFCPTATQFWGQTRIRGQNRALPLLIPEELCAPLGETFVNIRKIKKAARDLPMITAPPIVPALPTGAPTEGADAELARGIEKVQQNDLAGALSHFDRALLLNPALVEAHCARGYAKGQLADFEGASRDYTLALAISPGSVDANCGRGYIEAMLGDKDQAVADFSAAIRENPNCVTAYVNRGLLRAQSQEPSAALDDLETAIRLDPANPRLLLVRGILLAQAGRYQESVKDLSAAIAQDPKNARAQHALGIAEFELGETDRAVRSFGRAIDSESDFTEALLGRAIAQAMLGELEAALVDADRAVELDPSDDEALYQRGIIRSRLGRYSDGEADQTQALRFNPDHPFAHYSRGIARSGAGDQVGALADFDTALKRDPGFAPAYHARGLARRASGDEKGALKDLTRAGKLAGPSQPQRRLISDELDVRIRGQIRRNRKRGWLYLVLSCLAISAAIGFWPHDGYSVLSYLVFGWLVISSYEAFLRAKGSLDEPIDYWSRGFLILLIPVFLPYLILKAGLGSKTCFHCRTKNRFYRGRCSKCGASL